MHRPREESCSENAWEGVKPSVIWVVKFIETEGKMVVIGAIGRKKWRVIINGHEILVWKYFKKLWRWMLVMAAQ